MPNLYFLRGLPGSGKSTWAKAEVAKNPHGMTRINKDDIRAMLHGGVWGKVNENEVILARNALINNAMLMKKNIIVDDTNFHPSHEADIREMCKNNKYAFLVRNFDVPVEECIERDSKRENSVGAKVIQDMYDKYVAEKTIEQPKYEFADKSLTTVVMCDIDGTIAYMNGRGPYDTNVETDGYYMDIIELVKATKLPIVFMSGRKAITNAETGLWLLKKFKPSTIVGLFMRSDGDDRRDDIVKKELYDNHIKGKYNVKYVFDDRSRVIDMWRKEGLRCLQVQAGNF